MWSCPLARLRHGRVFGCDQAVHARVRRLRFERGPSTPERHRARRLSSASELGRLRVRLGSFAAASPPREKGDGVRQRLAAAGTSSFCEREMLSGGGDDVFSRGDNPSAARKMLPGRGDNPSPARKMSSSHADDVVPRGDNISLREKCCRPSATMRRLREKRCRAEETMCFPDAPPRGEDGRWSG